MSEYFLPYYFLTAYRTLLLPYYLQDLFTEKLATQPLSKYMTDYVGLNEFEPAVDFIKGKFLDRRKDPDKRVYVHATCATDTSNVRLGSRVKVPPWSRHSPPRPPEAGSPGSRLHCALGTSR